MEGAPAVREPAEPADSARAGASAEERLQAAAALAWLTPDAASLAALCRPSPLTWDSLRADPGAVLLVLRVDPSSFRLDSAALPETALRCLDAPGSGFVDWEQPAVRPVHRAAVRMAAAAQQLAERVGGLDGKRLWAAGLLAP